MKDKKGETLSFNFIPTTMDTTNEESSLPVIYELARDLKTLELLTKNNKFYTVSRNDAIKIWILKVLNKQSSRYTHRAYSSDYGNEITKLFGRNLKDSLLSAELERLVKEALIVNPYIKKIDNFTFKKEGSKVELTFTVTTVYGEIEQEINYYKE